MPRKQSQKQLDNLRPQNTRTKTEQRAVAKKGGIASGEARRKKSSAREVAKMILSGNIPHSGARELVEKTGLPKTEHNMQAAILAGQALEAIKGNTRAAEYLYSLSGEAAETDDGDKQQKYAGLPARVLGSEWVDVNRYVDDGEYAQYDFKGGRGSLKSSFCALKLIDLIMLNESYCALAVRQVKDNLKDSVYAQIEWAIDELGLTDQFKCTKSPMQIKRKSTGQVIYFRGAENPGKIKSIKPPNGMHIAVVWVEEADQLHGADGLRNITQSAFRGGDEGVLFRSFNVPISKAHFINRELLEEDPRKLVHHSHYKNAPKKWIGQRFIDDAEALLVQNERAYRHEYDGEATGTGANVFENVTAAPGIITDEMISRFDRIYIGLDFGYYPDPAAMVASYYDKARRTLYIFDEEVRHKAGNKEMAEAIQRWKRERITADSAEPKSIEDYRKDGFIMYGAKKGPGSVAYGMKWLASLSAIIIDSRRCPVAANEFSSYEYERTKDGEIISGYPDANNHCIDAVRYSLEPVNKWGVQFG